MSLRHSAAFVSLLLICACGGEEAEPLRSAVLITLDTTNRGALGVYGEDRGLTPQLDALAKESVVYERARSVAPLTMPSHSSMLTGLYPPRHTVRDNVWLPLPSSAETLAERARAAGYSTAAFLAAAVLRHSYGLDQGFEVYDEAPRTGGLTGGGERRADAVTKAAIEWLDRRAGDEPYFLWVHYFDPHAPYAPPAEALARAGGRAYLGEVAYLDEQVGRLLARLRTEPDWDATAVVVVADHGEGGGRHGETTHGMLVYDSTIAVPLFVRHPNRERAGERSQEVVSVVDVYPTLLGAMGLSAPGDVDGLDLAGGPLPADRGVYFETYYGYLNYGWAPLAGWADGEGKYIHGPGPELFASDDPDESENVYTADDARVARARAAIRDLAARGTLERGGSERSLASDENLANLGYAGAAAADARIPHPLEPGDLPAPRERLPEHYRAWDALALVDAGQVDEAVEALREIAAANPGNAFVHGKLGELLVRSGRAQEALEPLLAMVERGLERPNLRLLLTNAYAELGRYEEALAEAERYLELSPDDAEGERVRRQLLEALDAERE